MPIRRRIFLNYRQDDTGDAASFLDHVLSFVFGTETVFKASRSIGAGTVFPPAIETAMDETCVALVLVGPRWLDGRRLFRPDDWVRREAAYFLREDVGIPVIPVLVGGVRSVPPADELPPDLAPLTDRQTVHFRARHTSYDIPGLFRVLHEVAPGLAARHFLRPAPAPLADRLSSSLLRPEYEVVPFRGRDAELERLAAWRDSAQALDVEVLVGPAGQGKSRLTVEFCRRSREVGWIAGEPTEGTRAQDLARLSEAGVPLLVVMDRAESTAEEAAPTLTALAERAEGAAPARVILVARSMGAWFSELMEAGDATATALLHARARPLRLGNLIGDTIDRADEFRRATQRFADRLGLPESSRPEAPRPQGALTALDKPVGGDRILDLHAAALDAVLATSTGSADASADPIVRLLHHEWRDWKRSSVAAELPDPHRERLAAVVAVATLYGGRSERAAYKALAVQLTFRQEQMHVVRRYLRWVSRLYPAGGQPQGAAAPHALRPDRLGEEHVALTVLEQPELIRGVAGDLDEAHRERALLVLGRAAPRHPDLVPYLAELIESDPKGMVAPALWAAMRLEQPEPIVGALAASVQQHRDLPVAHRILDVAPHTEEYAGLRAIAARTVLSAERVRSSPDMARLAGASYQLGLASTLAGDRTEALRAARAAVEAYEALPEPTVYGGLLATYVAARTADAVWLRALVLLTYCLAVTGDLAGALRTARRGVERIWSSVQTWTPGVLPADFAVTALQYGLSPDVGRAVQDLDVFAHRPDEPAIAALLVPLRKVDSLKQSDALLHWALDDARSGGDAGSVSYPPDLFDAESASRSPIRAGSDEAMQAVRQQISAGIRDAFGLPGTPVVSAAFADVVAAARAAGVYRWDVANARVPDEEGAGDGEGEGGPAGVVAVSAGDGDLRALYWDTSSSQWVLDSLEVDAYGDFAAVGGNGSPLAGAEAAAGEVVKRLAVKWPTGG
ncbi:hypothetical protein ABZ916_43490 [Streptomyces sp. NPDC046853]|uniref:hypothetical protein n=1 Tax=Streptomyces sp. NPDC046853 TaxID=3154920 RepID=UPI0033FB3C36